MRIKKPGKQKGRYLPLTEIEKINTAFLDELERVKMRLGYVKDPSSINSFYDVLMNAYNAVIDLKTLEREVDYDIKLAEIEQRRRNLKPWRRCCLWRLIFQPLTNRAQDIIEARAELEADIQHTSEEKEIEDERNKNLPTDDKKLSKRKLKREMRAELKKIIKRADKADLNEAFEEPLAKQDESGNTEPKPKATSTPQGKGQLPGQLTLDDVQIMSNA
ncbi:MAG: hypothetical protein K2J83_07560, partial [Clostridia bacterium]|nr:hypothetical protein [Clostridia bacterium]